MGKNLLVLAVLVFMSMPAFAQSVDTDWVRRYDGPGSEDDWPVAMAVDDSGRIYVTGHCRDTGVNADLATIKYLPNGDTAWVRTYSGPGDYTDRAFALAIDASYNVYVTGEIYSVESSHDYVTIKYTPEGDTAWVRRYNGPGDAYDAAYAIAVSDSGYIYVTGSSRGSGT